MTAQPVHSVRPARERASRGERIFGYVLNAILQVTLIWLVNVAPGWRIVPFLTEDASRVIWLFNASVVIAFLVNAGWVLYDPPRIRRLGDAVMAAASLPVLARLLDLFPFEFASADWASVARVVLIVSIVGTAIAVLVNLVLAARRP